MRVFISWSGKVSQHVAKSLEEWFPMLFQRIDPWISGEAIDLGTRWNQELALALEETDFGILCLTKENQTEPWICFEAGALSKKFEKSKIIPLMIDFDAVDLEQPLKQFQAITAAKDDILKLVFQLHEMDAEDSRADEVFKKTFHALWPNLEERLEKAKTLLSEEEPAHNGDSFNLDESMKRIDILVTSISSRLSKIESRLEDHNSPVNVPFSSDEVSFQPVEIQKEFAAIHHKLDTLNKFGQVSELIRQADFLRDKNPPQAIIIYDKALKINEADAAALIGKAKTFRKLEKWENAISILDTVIDKNNKAERAYYNRACYKNLSKNYDKKDILSDLESAVNLFDKYKQYAIEDVDFENLKEDNDFKAICYGTPLS